MKMTIVIFIFLSSLPLLDAKVLGACPFTIGPLPACPPAPGNLPGPILARSRALTLAFCCDASDVVRCIPEIREKSASIEQTFENVLTAVVDADSPF
jgi:hypothetical protein